MPIDTKAVLKEKVTEFSPDLQRLAKVDKLLTDDGDAMSDLHEREIAAMSLFRALDEHIIEIPATMAFLENLKSLRRSRDRAGRQEFVNALKGRPSYMVNPYFDEPTAGPSQPGLLGRFFGMFRKKKQPQE